MVHATRERVADFLHAARPEEIVFGPNMTTLSFALSRALGKTLAPGDEIVLTRMDHDANVMPWLRIAEDVDLTVRWVDIHTDDCTLDMDSLEAALTDRTRIVATVHASNAVGTINPVKQIAAMARAASAVYVVDAVQSAPHIPIDVQDIGCDFLLCSAYKFFGPHIGILWGRYDRLAELPVYKVRPADDRPPFRWETGTASFETIHGVSAAIDYFAWIGSEFGADYYPDRVGRRALLLRGMEAIKRHEQALAQCGTYLATLGVPTRSVDSTAEACRVVADRDAPGWVALAGPTTGARYGLVPLAEQVADSTDSVTTFVLVRRMAPGVGRSDDRVVEVNLRDPSIRLPKLSPHEPPAPLVATS